MDIKLFQQKLNDICAIAEENNKQLSQQQIRDHFDESDLSTSQLVKILQYLKLKGITIEGADEAAGAARADAVSSESSDKDELPGTRAALTAEEQAYLSDYMESFSPEGLDPDDLASLFQAIAKGDTAAEGALTQFYMAQAAQMAAELNCEEIHLADLLGFLLEDTDKFLTDDLTLRFRLCNTGELVVISLLCVHADKVQVKLTIRSEYTFNLITFILTKKAMIYKYAGKLLADRSGKKSCCHGGIYTT